MAETYVCALCGETFVKGWSDEEAAAELAATFGPEMPIEACGLVCDDCDRVLRARLEELTTEDRLIMCAMNEPYPVERTATALARRVKEVVAQHHGDEEAAVRWWEAELSLQMARGEA